MLTGTIPPRHGIHDNMQGQVDRAELTLAEILSREGFITAAFVSAFVLDSQFGLNQGFDHYDDHFEESYNSVGINERRGDETTRLALQWLDTHKSEKFFLFLHYYDPHTTYDPPPAFAARFPDDP